MADNADAARERFEAWFHKAKLQFLSEPSALHQWWAAQGWFASAGQQQARVAELEGERERLREALQAVQSAIADGVFGDKGWSGRERALNEQISAALARQAGG